jgi:DNA-binding transcriptional MocR family regulator
MVQFGVMKKYEIIYEHIIRSIQTGNLQPGDFLPSIRNLAAQLNVSTTTVFDAYCKLENSGIVSGHERRGFSVTSTDAVPPMEDGPEAGDIDPPEVDMLFSYFNSSKSTVRPLIQLGAIAPAPALMPNRQMAQSLSRVCRAYADGINTYGICAENLELFTLMRKALAHHMFKSMGLTAAESEIVMTSGATEGLFLALAAIAKPGDLVAVETPGFAGAYNQIRHLGLERVNIRALPPHGMDIDELEGLVKSGRVPKAVICTPNFHNPTGALMPEENRARLLDLCARHRIVPIEDDVFGSLRFGAKIPTLKQRAPEDVIYVSSFSKTLAPGYRVGWIAGGKYSDNILIAQNVAPMLLSLSNHIAVSDFLSTGKFKSFIRDFASTLEANCEEIADILSRSFPKGTVVHKPEGGQFIWVTLPEKCSATDLHNEAIKRNILIAPGLLFTETGDCDNCIRFSFAVDLNDTVRDAIATVGRLARETAY